MKNLLFVLLLCAATPALAAGGAPGSTGAPGSSGAPGYSGGPGNNAGSGDAIGQGGQNGVGPSPEMRAEKFAERKAEILKRIDEHIAKAQQKKQCVAAAANHEALRACMPKRMERNNGQGGFQGGQGFRGPRGDGPQGGEEGEGE